MSQTYFTKLEVIALEHLLETGVTVADICKKYKTTKTVLRRFLNEKWFEKTTKEKREECKRADEERAARPPRKQFGTKTEGGKHVSCATQGMSEVFDDLRFSRSGKTKIREDCVAKIFKDEE